MKKIVVGIVMAATAFSVQAGEIANWDNNDLSGAEATAAADDSIANLASTPTLSRSGPANTYANTYNMRGTDDASLADALSTGNYISWTVEAASGFAVSMSDIFLRLDAANSLSGARDFALFSSATGFLAGDELDAWTIGGGGSGSSTYGTHTVTLSGVSDLQNSTAAIEFRLVAWGAGSGYDQTAIGRGFSTTTSEDDLTLNGTVTAL